MGLFVSSGFARGRSSFCNFHCVGGGLRVTVHGDDFATVGPRQALELFSSCFDSRCECKHKAFGPYNGEECSIRVLNRIVIWSNEGIEHDAGQRHGEILIEQLTFEEAKPVVAPGDRDEQDEVADIISLEFVSESDASSCRMIIARSNY